jgi:hypothetical protein
MTRKFVKRSKFFIAIFHPNLDFLKAKALKNTTFFYKKIIVQFIFSNKNQFLCNQTFLPIKKAYNTRDSQDVSDPSTNRAQRCLTCQIGRDGVFSTWYGRKRMKAISKWPFAIGKISKFCSFFDFSLFYISSRGENFANPL